MRHTHGPGEFTTCSHDVRRRIATAALVAALASPIAAADEAADEKEAYPDAFEVCTSCHAFEKGEPTLVGPTLYLVYGRRIASVPGYDYSQALRSVSGTWDRPTLDRWLTNPQALAPGTKMTMGGLHDAGDRKEVIDFLEQQAHASETAGANDATP
jgi:cytochrome c